MRSGRAWQWGLYSIVALAFVALLIWATRAALSQNPAREATTELGPFGLVTIRFTTTPNPALPTGPVAVGFMPMDARGRPVTLDGLRVEYGQVDSDQVYGNAVAEPMSDGSGMFMSRIQFPTAGSWWLRVQFSKDAAQGAVRFTMEVRPAQ